MTAMAGRIEIVSAERVRDELVKLLLRARPAAGPAPARRDRPRRPRPARAAGAARWSATSTTATRTSTSTRLTVLEQAIDLEHRLGGAPRPRRAARRAAARHRQAHDPALRGRRQRDLPPPRGGRRQAGPQAAAGAALRQRRRSRRSPSWSSCTCASTATARASGPTRPCAATSATPAPELERLHVLTRADCTTRNQRKADRLRRTLRPARGADRRARRAGGARRDPPRPRRQPDHGDPRRRARAARSARPTVPARAADRPGPDVGRGSAEAALRGWWASSRPGPRTTLSYAGPSAPRPARAGTGAAGGSSRSITSWDRARRGEPRPHPPAHIRSTGTNAAGSPAPARPGSGS